MYFNIDEKIIFQFDSENHDLYVNELIWSDFKLKFGYSNNEMRKLIKVLVEKFYIKNTIVENIFPFC